MCPLVVGMRGWKCVHQLKTWKAMQVSCMGTSVVPTDEWIIPCVQARLDGSGAVVRHHIMRRGVYRGTGVRREVLLQHWSEEASHSRCLTQRHEGVSTVCCHIMNRRVYKGYVCGVGGWGWWWWWYCAFMWLHYNYLLAVKHPQWVFFNLVTLFFIGIVCMCTYKCVCVCVQVIVCVCVRACASLFCMIMFINVFCLYTIDLYVCVCTLHVYF